MSLSGRYAHTNTYICLISAQCGGNINKYHELCEQSIWPSAMVTSPTNLTGFLCQFLLLTICMFEKFFKKQNAIPTQRISHSDSNKRNQWKMLSILNRVPFNVDTTFDYDCFILFNCCLPLTHLLFNVRACDLWSNCCWNTHSKRKWMTTRERERWLHSPENEWINERKKVWMSGMKKGVACVGNNNYKFKLLF